MRITPLDVRKQEFRRAVRGLDADEVQAFLATVADEYEFVLTDNKKLRDRVIELDEKLGEYRNMEKTLRDTLLTAERVMSEARQNARKEAELILRDAQMQATQQVAGISGRVESLHQQIRELRSHRDSYLARLHSLSEAQLTMVDSYRKDFDGADQRVDRVVGAAQGAVSQPAPSAVAPAPTTPASAPIVDAPAAVQPAVAPPVPQPAPAPSRDDQWRGYNVRDEQPAAPGPSSGDSDYAERVASVADALSGSVPLAAPQPASEGEEQAIDEVSEALGMFTEERDSMPDEPFAELEDYGYEPSAGRSGPMESYPGPDVVDAHELAPAPGQQEPVDAAGSSDYPMVDTTDPTGAAAELQSEELGEPEQGGWSFSRIARGITGH